MGQAHTIRNICDLVWFRCCPKYTDPIQLQYSLHYTFDVFIAFNFLFLRKILMQCNVQRTRTDNSRSYFSDRVEFFIKRTVFFEFQLYQRIWYFFYVRASTVWSIRLEFYWTFAVCICKNLNACSTIRMKNSLFQNKKNDINHLVFTFPTFHESNKLLIHKLISFTFSCNLTLIPD